MHVQMNGGGSTSRGTTCGGVCLPQVRYRHPVTCARGALPPIRSGSLLQYFFLRRIETISRGGQTRPPRGIRHGKSRFTEAVGLPASVRLRVVDSISKPLRLYCDNKVAVFHANNNKSSGAAKHIEIKYFVVKDRIQDHTIELEHISTKEMLADPLTKGLPPNIFHELIAGMGLSDSL